MELDFDDADVFFNLGNVYSSFDENKSKKYWEMSVQRYAKKIESLKEDASAYLKQSRSAEPPKIELKDTFYEIGQCFYNLGDLYSCLEKYSHASDSYKKSF